MRAALIAAVIAIGFSAHVPGFAQGQSAAPKVQVRFEPGGLVTLTANGATIREILSEWSRQGGSKFINAERLTGAPMTLEFKNQPEAEVIGAILRSASGFLLGPRRAENPGASSFELVYILPTSNPVGGAYTPPPPVAPPPQMTTSGAPDDELPPVQGRGEQPPPGPQQGPGPQPAPTDPPKPANSTGSSVVVPVVPVPVVPVTNSPPPTTTGRGGGGAAGSL